MDYRWHMLMLKTSVGHTCLFLCKEVRPDDWVPTEAASNEHDDCIDGYSKIHQASEDGDRNVVDIFSIHSGNGAGTRWIFFTRNKVNTVPRSGYHFMTVIELQRFTLILC